MSCAIDLKGYYLDDSGIMDVTDYEDIIKACSDGRMKKKEGIPYWQNKYFLSVRSRMWVTWQRYGKQREKKHA